MFNMISSVAHENLIMKMFELSSAPNDGGGRDAAEKEKNLMNNFLCLKGARAHDV